MNDQREKDRPSRSKEPATVQPKDERVPDCRAVPPSDRAHECNGRCYRRANRDSHIEDDRQQLCREKVANYGDSNDPPTRQRHHFPVGRALRLPPSRCDPLVPCW